VTSMEAGKLLVELGAAYPQMKLPLESAKVWRSWLEAMPYQDTRRGLLVVCAREEFPKITHVIAAAGIVSEQAVSMLVAARDGGYAIVRDDQAPHGWRTTRDALPAAPTAGYGPSIPMPEDVRRKIEAAVGRIVAAKDVT
jgi:hypothetical protein